ncbi:hypothetical protein C0J52_03796 [Blattella germanica]|nr:hypothetical protein C0J52_03796 [Blattella germanica]
MATRWGIASAGKISNDFVAALDTLPAEEHKKPLTLNLKQTKELISLAKEKKLFLMEAIWSRCFPAYEALKKEIESGSIGEVLQVMVGDLLKELGGGTILDLGVYVLQFAQFIFGPSAPESVQATGYLNENGVDTSSSFTLKYKGEKTATLLTHSKVQLPNEAFVIGTKGVIKVMEPFWCPTSIKTPEKTKEFVLPAASKPFNFTNSAGLRYEAMEVRQCLKKGVLESPKVSHQDSLVIAQLEDEIRKQIGKISHDFVTALSTLPLEEHQVVAVAARQLDRAVKFAEEHNIPQAYDSYEEIANDPNVEVAYIGTINVQHFEVTKMMLNHGKHVLCEKPLTLNLKESKELINLAKEKKLFLMEAIWSRCFPVYDAVKKELESGALGDVLQVTACLGTLNAHVDRVKFKEMGGGNILNIGVYVLQLAQFVFGPSSPENIVALSNLNAEGMDTNTSMILKYKDGKMATLTTHGKIKLQNDAYIVGTNGFIKSPKLTHSESLMLATLEDEIRRQLLPFLSEKFFLGTKLKKIFCVHCRPVTHITAFMATRWGIASAGKISNDFVTVLRSLNDHKVIAVAARDLNRAKEFADDHNIPVAYGSYEDLAKDPNIDVIYIGAINSQHLSIGKLMLNGGKHVLCEKPLAMNLKEANELITLAKQKKLFLMEGVWSRCFPAYQDFKKEIESYALGDIHQVIVSLGGPIQEMDRIKITGKPKDDTQGKSPDS